eukprot:CAMPEP_0172037932 /NCGR_PEP_ID=MMETSP1041-20130122/23027_1 /TAXON_ID=464988 /ORGANISM="Hemiselmis andersenii, Strain CCMP439" /LENGTH=196 /DNA_ID=CAMNT_0012695393 /DNA_START=675 /DNA_END=1265 /DNA_ORIENTATION=+
MALRLSLTYPPGSSTITHPMALIAPATILPHTRMVAGAMSAMGWVMVEEPGGYVKDSLNAIPVYGRQVRDVEGEEHSRLVQALTDLIKALRALVEHHFAKGLIKAGGGLVCGRSVAGASAAASHAASTLCIAAWVSPSASLPIASMVGFCILSALSSMLRCAANSSPTAPPCVCTAPPSFLQASVKALSSVLIILS